MESAGRAQLELPIRPDLSRPPLTPSDDFAARLSETIDRGVRHLLSLQSSEGYWLGELEADTTLESDYIFYLLVLGKDTPARISKLANYVRQRQLPDGGWNIYFGGPSELNATTKAYIALKLAGDDTHAPHMESARLRIHALGGLEATNSYVRFYLALAGAVSWDIVPAVPPELMLLPNWFPINIYEMSSWTRGIVIPLTILHAKKPHWPLRGLGSAAGSGNGTDRGSSLGSAAVSGDGSDCGSSLGCMDELFRDPQHRDAAFDWGAKLFSWRNIFLALDRCLKLYEHSPWKPLRKRALRRSEEWMLEHVERTEGLAAIYPSMMNTIFALLALGRGPDDPLTVREIDQLARFEIEDAETIRLQPCVSPVWDTAIALVSLAEAGLPPDHPNLRSSARWLLDHQVLGSGDWQVKNPGVRPGGWVFEFRNDFYPDVDDTAFVLMALQRVDYPDKPRMEEAIRLGINWLLAMQNRDGGWGAFDKNNDRQFLTQIPFADHNAMIDPSSADVTARVVECLGRFGWSAAHPVLQRAVAYLRQEQTPEGAWYGRWGVNYIYGTSGVLRALETIGLAGSDFCQRAAAWLRSVQQTGGGFGESIASYYDEKLKGQGDVTPSQTAWALIGLLATEGDARASKSAVMRSVAHLLQRQNADGSWDEEPFTGTGFPCVFYLKYHLYRNCFPLYALSRFRNLAGEGQEFQDFEIRPESLEAMNATREVR